MKKINVNAILTIVVSCIIIVGCCNKGFSFWLQVSCYDLIDNVKKDGVFVAITKFTDAVEDVSTEQLSYHDFCVNLNSAFMRLTNRRIVEKEDVIVVKMDNGMLAEEEEYRCKKDLHSFADAIKTLQDDTSIPVTYVMAPKKGYNGGFPINADNYISENCDNFLEILRSKEVNYLDLRVCMDEDNMMVEDVFFVTDHHWTPHVGLWATNQICKKLQTDYDFQYNEELLNIENYNINTYKNSFLGSEGRKTGIYYTKYGLEDFDLIFPNFTTEFTVANIMENTQTTGDFRKTLINEKYLNYESPYQSWMYSAYSDGDNSLQVIENDLRQDGDTILLIRDSFACVVSPFLALECKAVHCLDLREDVTKTDRVQSVTEYARQIKPDHIVILYSGVASQQCYQFN